MPYSYRTIYGGVNVMPIGDIITNGSPGALLSVGAGPVLAQVPGAVLAWTPYTPTITPGSGTFTTASASGRYLQIGKIFFLQVQIAITTNGSAGANISFTLPATVGAAAYATLSGRGVGVSGKQLQAVFLGPGATSGFIWNYDNSYPGSTGELLVVSGVIEIQ
jgi:hypothetical protein